MQHEPSDLDLEAIEHELPSWEDPLEEILAECLLAAPARRRPKADTQEAPRHGTFTNPSNWERTRGIALIHAETETLLGNFSEYTHRSVRGTRKLIREEAPLLVSATERVSGSWWLGEDRRPVEPRQAWHEQRPAILHLHLATLGVHSPAVEVIAFLSYGSVARVELAASTRFAAGDGKTLLDLPAGMNVLGEMTLDSKLNLRKEIGL